MAAAFGASLGSAASAAGSPSLTLTTSGAVPAASGNRVVVGMGFYNSTAQTPTLSGGSLTWVREVLARPNTDTGYHVVLFSADATAGLASATGLVAGGISGGSTFGLAMAALYLTGIATVSYVDQTASGTAAGVTVTVNLPTTTNADDGLVCFTQDDFAGGANTSTAGGGFTETADFVHGDGFNYAMSYRIVAATGAYSPSTTFSAGGPSNGAAAAFKGAAAAGGSLAYDPRIQRRHLRRR